MAKGTTTIVLGIIYCSIVGLCWLFINSRSYYYYYSSYIGTIGGMFALFANILLIPSFILYLIFFCSSEGSTSASVGFGLGMAGWVVGLLGQILHFIFYSYSSSTAILYLIFYVSLTVFGSLLFTRRHRWEALQGSYSQATPQQIASRTGVPGAPCPDCNHATRFIAQYERVYCDHCQKYM